jgi:hypothetical protein
MADFRSMSGAFAGALRLGGYFASSARNLIDSRVAASVGRRDVPTLSTIGALLQAAAGSGAIDQILQGHLGTDTSVAALIEVVASLVGQGLQDDADARRAVERRLNALLEQQLRVALDEFRESVALGLTGHYEQRFDRSGERVQEALSSIDGQFENGVMDEQDHRQFRFVYASMHAICGRVSGDPHAARLRLTVATIALEDLIRLSREEAEVLQSETIPHLREELENTKRTEVRVRTDEPDSLFDVAVGGYAHKKQLILKNLRAIRTREEAQLASQMQRFTRLRQIISASDLMQSLLNKALF